ncbi:GNAT family N-acetyltransferase [Nocardioides pantholopis]|uniref:GNAT family N-acetyltransferase n=1 Tax=Nocardioides pantholopis TaxID=2483798 RepID=UPI0019D2B853|nr:GNAT family N-acetyltransferase [Nocardioides pantholopis]
MTPAEDELLLRPAGIEDAPAVAAVHLASRRSAVRAGTMPPAAHPDAEALPWLRGRLATDEVWVAEVAGAVVAYLRLSGDWIDDLYVVPGQAGRGIGTALLELAKQLRPAGFGLWVFEINAPARRFYARHGLVEVERTDGSENEERSPDIRVVWQPD